MDQFTEYLVDKIQDFVEFAKPGIGEVSEMILHPIEFSQEYSELWQNSENGDNIPLMSLDNSDLSKNTEK